MKKDYIDGIFTYAELNLAIKENPQQAEELKAEFREREKTLNKFRSSLKGEQLKSYLRCSWPLKILMYFNSRPRILDIDEAHIEAKKIAKVIELAKVNDRVMKLAEIMESKKIHDEALQIHEEFIKFERKLVASSDSFKDLPISRQVAKVWQAINKAHYKPRQSGSRARYSEVDDHPIFV